MTMTVAEIERTLENYEIPRKGYGGGTYTDSGWYVWNELADCSEIVVVPDLGTVEVVESVGGGEGSGEHMLMIFAVTDDYGNVRWFKKLGWYASYDGGYWDGGFSEVRPREKTVTVYE